MYTTVLKHLTDANPPWVYLADVDNQVFYDALAWLQEAGYVITELDCSTMLTAEQLFERFAAAAEFPSYFGMNWPAFDECLADLEWLPASGYVFILRNPEKLLAEEPIERTTFWKIIAKVAAEWAKPVNLGEWWDRESIPFHVVMEMVHGSAPLEDKDKVSISGVEAAFLGSLS